MTVESGSLLVISRWLPAQFQAVDDHAEALRIRIFLILILLCIIPLLPLLLILVGTLLFGLVDYWKPALMVALIVFSQTACLLHFLKSGNINRCSVIYSVIIFLLIGASTFLTGGWESPVCNFMLALPVIAYLVLSRSAGIVFALTVLLLYTILFMLSQKGYVAEQYITPEFSTYASIAMWITTLFFIVGCLLLFDLSTEDLATIMQQEKQQWQTDLDFDELTNTLNPKAFLALLGDGQSGEQKTNNDIAFVYVRVNNLSEINRDFGLDAGDHLLQQTAERIKKSVVCSHISRYTPNSFVICIKTVADPGVLISHIIRLKKALQKNISYGDELVLPGQFSIGAAISSNANMPASELINAAISNVSTNDKTIYIRK